MSGELRVYLDHLITRESFRYVRPTEEMRAIVSAPARYLTLKNLQDQSRAKFLRKPDFQRATWAWSPEDCVLLLDSLIQNQVVPSVIMWSSPSNGLDYILDGGHRVSVALAWLHNDWGDGPEADVRSATREQAQMIREAAQAVRLLVSSKIGAVEDYQEAEKDLYQVITQGGNPSRDLDPKTFTRGLFYQNLLKDNIGFNIQYVVGNYEIAEESFLKINRSGRVLSNWEKILIQNRNSSFGRAVMSIANIKSVQHYWPHIELSNNDQSKDAAHKVNQIVRNVNAIHETLLTPEYKTPIKNLHAPFLVASIGDQRAFYIAEFLTIVSGGKGQESETDELLKADVLLTKDTTASEEEIINNGLNLTNTAIDILKHIWNPFPEIASPNRSLALVAPLYFYTNAGRPVRGLLYGLLYWLLGGDEDVVRERKRIFSAYRGKFEQIYIESKEDIVTGFSRNIGSGSEVTIPVARYFNNLLSLLIRHKGDITSDEFIIAYSDILGDIHGKKVRTASINTIRSRGFSAKQRSTTVLNSLLISSIRCDICGGILNPSGPIQHDHIKKSSQGGPTSMINERLTHPFCNQHRDHIERIANGQASSVLPPLRDADLDGRPVQLKIFDDGFLSVP